jgi:uridine kinase
VVEGILVLTDERLRSRLDVKLFVDTDADIRLMRRVRRDLEQRGRTFAQIRKQYYETVRPMHMAFVEPSKRFADIIVPEGGQNLVALDMILSHLRSRM